MFPRTISASRLALNRVNGTSVVSTRSFSRSLENLVLAEEKPVPAPRIIDLKPEKLDIEGTVRVNVMSMKTGELTDEQIVLNGSVFGAPERSDILQRVVKWHLACQRAGTHKTKTRSEVSGSTRKPWPQKGTGRARVSDIRAPHWRGGYKPHGPKVRDYSYDLPKKVRAMGLRVALSTKLREQKLVVLDSLEFEEAKTKAMKATLDSYRWDDALFVDAGDVCENFELASSNLARVDVIANSRPNVYSILKRDLLVLTVDAVKELEERLVVY